MKICFMGTSSFAVKALEALLQNNYDIACVYTKAPSKKGRGQQLSLSEVHQLALSHNITCRTPRSLKKSQAEQDYFIAQKFDLVVVAAYGLILPECILTAPRYGAINIHGSLLPRWRGASPIQMAIASQDKQTGITIIQMNQGLDTGDIILQTSLPITLSTTFTHLHEQLSQLGASMIIQVLKSLANNSILRVKQEENLATYAHLLVKKDGYLDFNQTATAIDCKVRAFNPFLSTLMYYQENIKVLSTTPLSLKHHQANGTILSVKPLQIACLDSVLQIDYLQRKGKQALPASEFIKGFNFKIGELVEQAKDNN